MQRMQGPWYPRLIAALADQRREGVDFNDAWRAAVLEHPPAPRDIAAHGTSFSVELDCYRRFARDAWFDLPARDGSPSRLRHLSSDLAAA